MKPEDLYSSPGSLYRAMVRQTKPSSSGEDSKSSLNRRRFLAASTVIATTATAGCAGGGDDGGDGGGGTTDTQGGTVGNAGQENVEITIISGDISEAARSANKQITSSFKEKTGHSVTIDYQPGPDALNRISSMIRGGNPPELAVTGSQISAPLLGEGQLAPVGDLHDRLKDTQVGSIPKGMVVTNTDGEPVTVPYLNKAWGSCLHTHYLEEVGITPPQSIEERFDVDFETWSQWLEAIDKGTDAAGYAFGYSSSSYSAKDILQLLWGNGVVLWEGTAPNDVELVLDKGDNRMRAVEAIDFLVEKILPYAIDGSNLTWSDANTGMAEGKFGMAGYTPGSVATTIHGGAGKDKWIDTLMGIPKPQRRARPDGGRVRAAPQGFNFIKGSDHPEVARDYVTHYFTSDGFWTYINSRPLHNLPPTPSLMKTDKFRNNWFVERRPDEAEYILEIFERGAMLSSNLDPRLGGVNIAHAKMYTQGVLNTMMQEVILQDKGIEDALDSAASTIREFPEVVN